MPIATIQKYDFSRSSRKGGVIITPPLSGVSEWNILQSPIIMSSYGLYTISSSMELQVLVKMWGAAGGGCGHTALLPGGGGGYSEGIMTLSGGITYKVYIGEAGKSGISSTERWVISGSGGGASAISEIDDSPIIVAGGGGGSGTYGLGGKPGAGGGLIGQNAQGGASGGSQSSGGTGGHGSRRNGGSGSLRMGGLGSPVSVSHPTAGGRGYGVGGAGTYFYDDGPGGGGAGGYYGGGGGGGDMGGYGGAGGSGYIHPSLVSSSYTETGVYDIPAKYEDAARLNAGGTVNYIPQDGRVIISVV